MSSTPMARINGTSASEKLRGTSNSDTIYGVEGNDSLEGLDGIDVLYGGIGNDRLFGGSGSDLLYGGEGNDTLIGDADGERLSGGPGRDTLTGGSGADVFFFSTSYSGITAATADTITDWNAKSDQVDMYTPSAALDGYIKGTPSNYIETRTTATSIEAAATFAEATFTGDATAHVFLYNSATDTGYLVSDMNNDGRFEMGIILRGAGAASNFGYGDIV